MPQIGDTLHDRYRLKQKLGQDASRQTWLAQDIQQHPELWVVVKLLALSPDMQWDECKLFEREAQVLQKLDHPRIPKYHDYFVLDQLSDSRFAWFCLVQTYIAGSSLQHLLDTGKRFTADQIEQIAIEVLTILIFLHELESPILHRDIKPSNLIWGDDQRTYLVDFGAVQDQAVVEGATFTVVGTYGYVPMEQFGGRAVAASDLYALGATLVHLLTGTAPADLPQRDGRIQFGDQVSVDSGFVLWVSRLLEPNLANRFSSARQALEALEHRQNLSLAPTQRQPTASRIRLHKTVDQMHVFIPRRGWQAVSLLYQLGIAGSFWYWWFQAFTNPIIALIILACFLGSIRKAIKLALLATDIRCDRQFFTVRWKLFGLTVKRRRVNTASIANSQNLYEQKQQGSKGITIGAGRLQLHTNPMAEVERIWLLQEMKDWFDLDRPRGSSERG
jgi:serine/threonine protein kinase